MFQIILLFNVFPLSVFSITVRGPLILFLSSFPHPPLVSSPVGYNLFPTSSYWLSQMPDYAFSDSCWNSALQKTASHKLFCQEFCSVCPQDSAHPASGHCLSRHFDLTCSALRFLINFLAPETPSNELLN